MVWFYAPILAAVGSAIAAGIKGYKTLVNWLIAWSVITFFLSVEGLTQTVFAVNIVVLIIVAFLKKKRGTKTTTTMTAKKTEPSFISSFDKEKKASVSVKKEEPVKTGSADVKKQLPPDTIWICPDCGEENEDSVCKGCGRIWRGSEKMRTRMPRSEGKNTETPEKTPDEEKSSITEKKSTPAEAVIAKGKTEPKRSEIIYFDKDKKITTKDKAVYAVIHEYDAHGNIARTVWGNLTWEDEDEEPSSLETIIAEIREGLTGDLAKDKDYLNQQIERYREHPDHHEIIKECGRLLFAALTESEKNEWAEAMHADDHPSEKTKDSRPFLILKRRKDGETIRVEQPVTILGKDLDSDIQLHSPKADEVNAVILLKDNLWFAANDFSPRALTVNGKKVQPGERRPLKKGDIIYIAEVETFEIAECVNSVSEALLN